MVLALAWIASSTTVSGHDEGARAEVLPSSVVAGATVEVAATDLVPNLAVRVQLVTGSGPIDIGNGETDGTGRLMLLAVVPESAVPRYYEIHVAAASGVVAVGYVEVEGRAAAGGPGEAMAWPWLAALAVLVGGTVALAGRRSRPERSRR